MNITAQDLDLLFQIEIHAQKCIRAVMYAEAVSGTETNMWAFAQNCFAESAILHWCKIFGSHKEPTHYKRFFNGNCFKMTNGTHLTVEPIRGRFCKSAGISEDEYLSIWENIKEGRDKFFVHNEFTVSSRPKLPDLELLKKMALEMRDIIHDIISQEDSEDSEKHKLFKDIVQWNKNHNYLKTLQNDCGYFKKAVSIKTEAENGIKGDGKKPPRLMPF
jgi:hypothetical protein